MNRFENLIRDHYGTLKQFHRDLKINHITAANYMREPERMQVRFIQRLARRLNITEAEILNTIVGEGEE